MGSVSWSAWDARQFGRREGSVLERADHVRRVLQLQHRKGDRDMRVLVTGGAGFIGSHLARALVRGGDQVVVLDNLRRSTLENVQDIDHGGALEFIEGDIRDLDVVRRACRGVQRVYHLAAQSNVLGAVSDIDYSFTSNVVGTYHVLVAARDAGIERVVFTSSREVYGEVGDLPVSEEHAMNPKNAYGASKVAGEVYCRTFASAYDLDVSVLRLANVYGYGDRDRVIPIWLDRATHGQDLELFGGIQVLDLVPVGLVVEALQRAAATDLHGQPVNVGSGRGTTLRELAERVQELSGTESDLSILPARTVEVTRFIADVDRMKSLLGLSPPTEPLVDLPSLWERVRMNANSLSS
jgi:UDP-glucose 4-epimerase